MPHIVLMWGVCVVQKGKTMIRADMKVGDKFTDGNRTFEVLAVCGNGVYVSKCIDVKVEPETIEVPKVETKETKAYTKTEINRMPLDKLEELCEELGLEKSTGTNMKKEIISKLAL